ncbi:MAG TPA: NAD(P)/FAD-dependent oxidoreductase [Vicinamibacteria bacterium]|nr:NAD(P)/FAD-dependent oxidoreductase [Vicinamibacteria bacterium]
MRAADAIVVGGGPAGSTVARALRAAGLDVLVRDQAVFPRHKVCAGWITPGVVDALSLDLEDYARSRVLQPITRFRTGVIGGPLLETEYGRPVSYGILRCEFDAYLLRRSGADVHEGARVERLERDGGDWLVDGEARAPLLVGAGGHFCPVARHLGARRERDPVVVAQEIEVRLTASQENETGVRGDTPELYFCADLKGYGWAFRKGDRLNVGLGRLDRQELSRHVAAFRELLVSTHRVPADLPARWHGHAYLLYEAQRPRLVDEGALLVGDAAGLAYAASGEGIRPAVESARLAAQTIVAARGRYSREDLEPYPRALAARFGRRDRHLSLPIPAGLVAAAGRRLFRSGWFAKRVVLDRWFLHADLPALSVP